MPDEPVRLHTAAEREWRHRGPTPAAVQALRARGDQLRRLPGGQGNAWTDGRLVLKPVGCVPEHAWICEVYAAWTAHDEVRVPEPVAPAPGQGHWSVDGWGAHVFVPGRDTELPREIETVREASDAFHARLPQLPRPGFLDERDDPWSYGDRLAWEDATPIGHPETVSLVTRLREHLAPVTEPDQAIHGDVLPNVLLADGQAPAVIDWPLYFRPAGLANAIAVTDAVTFRDAPLALLDRWAAGDDWGQLLVRALLYRLGPTGFFERRDSLMGSLLSHVERARPVVDAVLAR